MITITPKEYEAFQELKKLKALGKIKIPKKNLTPEERKELQKLAKNRKKTEKWLQKNKEFINITSLEKTIDAPKGIVQKYLKYNIPISDRWIEPLHTLIKGFTSFSIK